MNTTYSFNIRTMTIDDVRRLIRSGVDSHNNQIRVTTDGIVFLSQITGADSLQGIKFRYETFDAGNGYVGLSASNDTEMIVCLFRSLKKNWENGNRTYIDDWRL